MNAKGISLLEFMIATLFLVILIVSGLGALDFERAFAGRINDRTAFEQESNYRMIVIRSMLEDSSESLKLDPFLQRAPICFPGVDFGQEPSPDSFSVARPLSRPARFERDGTLVLTDRPLEDQAHLLLLAGLDSEAAFGWNYARVMASGGMSRYELSFLLDKPPLEAGALVEVEMRGVRFRDSTVYVLNPGGSSSPFFSNVEDFRYDMQPPHVRIQWSRKSVQTQFMLRP